MDQQQESFEDVERKGVGGKYSILNMLIAQCILDEDVSVEINPKDVSERKGLCLKSINNSLNGLVKQGLLVKENVREANTGYKLVKYKINPKLVHQYLGGLFVSSDDKEE